MKKEHNITFWHLIASRLIVHMIAAVLGIFFVNLLFNHFLLPYYIDRYPWPAPGPVFFDTNLKQYESITEQELIDSQASLQVLNEQLTVIYSKHCNQTVGYTYSIAELTDLLFKNNQDYLLRTDKFQNTSGQEVLVLLQFSKNLTEILQQSARNYGLLLTVISGIIVLLTSISFIRSIYLPVKQNLVLIRNSIVKTPHDTSPVDTSLPELREIQIVLQCYNDMLLEMDQIKQDKEHSEAKSHRLIANLSHDLKSPMTTLKGYAELLEQGEATPTEQLQYIQHIHNNVQTLNRMVELLSEQVKYQYNDYPLHLEQKDMNDFLREICANYYNIFEEQGFSMDIRIAEEPYLLWFDQIHLRRVYSNLLENILNHNTQPTQVQIVTQPQPDGLLIQIKDNGVGICAQHQDKVFEPYYQGDLSRSKHNSGLGLFVVKQILEKHHASIFLKTEAQFKTVFQIFFPNLTTSTHSFEK